MWGETRMKDFKPTVKAIATASTIGSLAWFISVSSFSAKEFVDLEFDQETKQYIQVVEVKTHGWFTKLLATVSLAGMGAIAYKEWVKDFPKLKTASIAKPPVKDFVAAPLSAPSLFVKDDGGFMADIPATEIQSPPKYTASPSVIPTVVEERSSDNVLASLYAFPKRHLLCVGETGAGKTSLLLGLLKTAHEKSGGAADVYVCTVKRGLFLGLETQIDEAGNSRRIIVDQVTGQGLIQLMKALRHCLNKMAARGEAREQAELNREPAPVFPPIIFVLDEMNTLLSVAAAKGKKEDFLALVNAIANTGREDNVRVWIFGQDYQVQNLGINTGNRDNFGISILGRIYDSEESNQEIFACEKMESAFIGKTSLVDNGREYWESFLAIAQENKGIPVIWTSLSRKSCLMPYMPDIKHTRLWQPEDLSQARIIPQIEESHNE